MNMEKLGQLGALLGGVAASLAVVGGIFVFVVTLMIRNAVSEVENSSSAQVKTVEINAAEELRDQVSKLTQKIETLKFHYTAHQEGSDERVDLQPQIERMERSFAKGHRNPHCQESATTIDWRVNATEGWRIIPETVRVELTNRSANSEFAGVQNLTEKGFNVRGTVSNNGECIHVFGNRIAKDGRGSLDASGSYFEERIGS